MGSRRALLLLAAEGPDDEVVVSRKKLGRLVEETDRIRSDLEKEREERVKLRQELERKSRELEDRDRDLQRKQRELEKSRQSMERLKHKIATLQVAPPSSKQLKRPTMPAPAEPPPKGRRSGRQPGHPPHVRPRPDHVDESRGADAMVRVRDGTSRGRWSPTTGARTTCSKGCGGPAGPTSTAISRRWRPRRVSGLEARGTHRRRSTRGPGDPQRPSRASPDGSAPPFERRWSGRREPPKTQSNDGRGRPGATSEGFGAWVTWTRGTRT